MPLYEYQCLDCGEVAEVIQRFDDPPRTTCESCGGKVKKLISAPAFQFKGSGWYVTDYASKGGRGKAESEGSGSEAKADGAAAPVSSKDPGKGSTAAPGSDGGGGKKASSTTAPAGA